MRPTQCAAIARRGAPKARSAAMTPVQPTDPALRHDAAAAVLASPLAIDGHAGFAAAVHATLAAAFAREARVLLWVDEDFGSWPLDDAALLGALGSWLRRPLRQLRLLARDYDALARSHPRFARWRADWTHAIDARRPDPAMRAPLPTLVLDDGPVLLRLAQRDPPRGLAASDAQTAWQARDDIGPVWELAEPAWPLRPLGL
jgi:hypothetical protein